MTDDTVRIALRRRDGQVFWAEADAADEPLLSSYTWHARIASCTVYAQTMVRVSPTRQRALGMHRLLVKAPEGMLVDHIDGNGLNNRRSNLRAATSSQNAQNSRSFRGASPYKGVSWRSDMKCWVVTIAASKRREWYGPFANEIDAAMAYDRRAIEIHGAFAVLNFPAEHPRSA